MRNIIIPKQPNNILTLSGLTPQLSNRIFNPLVKKTIKLRTTVSPNPKIYSKCPELSSILRLLPLVLLLWLRVHKDCFSGVVMLH